MLIEPMALRPAQSGGTIAPLMLVVTSARARRRNQEEFTVKYDLINLSPDIGVEIRGIDPRTLDPAKAAVFREAFADRHLVLIRDIDLSDDEGSVLTELLGPVSFDSPVMKKGGNRKFSFIGNVHEEGKLRDGELYFHSDHTFFPHPLKAISLYALAAPSKGGETVFANAASAYRRLPEPVKHRIANLKARHIASYSAFEGDARPRFNPNSRDKVSIHPVVWAHPESGEQILFVSRLLTESIIGMEYEESEALLTELFTYIEDPAHHYVHQWRVGDYLVWDNRQLQHSRRDFDPTEKRAMRRVPIGETPTAAA
jgi:taurine dioxygenase